MSRRYLENDLIEVFVAPLYMRIMGGRMVRFSEYGQWESLDMTAQILASVNQEVIGQLLESQNWRVVITASWFVGVYRLESFQEKIGRLLVASPVCYAGQAHCFTMVRLANQQSLAHLESYLNHWLNKPECRYDQNWAMAAYNLVAQKLKAVPADKFLEKEGLWDRFCQASGRDRDIQQLQTRLVKMETLADELVLLAQKRNPIPLRLEPSPGELAIMQIQRGLVRLLYHGGVTGKSRWFPQLLQLARSGPLGYYHPSHWEWHTLKKHKETGK